MPKINALRGISLYSPEMHFDLPTNSYPRLSMPLPPSFTSRFYSGKFAFRHVSVAGIQALILQGCFWARFSTGPILYVVLSSRSFLSCSAFGSWFRRAAEKGESSFLDLFLRSSYTKVSFDTLSKS
jgi:hypothetical protein